MLELRERIEGLFSGVNSDGSINKDAALLRNAIMEDRCTETLRREVNDNIENINKKLKFDNDNYTWENIFLQSILTFLSIGSIYETTNSCFRRVRGAKLLEHLGNIIYKFDPSYENKMKDEELIKRARNIVGILQHCNIITKVDEDDEKATLFLNEYRPTNNKSYNLFKFSNDVSTFLAKHTLSINNHMVLLKEVLPLAKGLQIVKPKQITTDDLEEGKITNMPSSKFFLQEDSNQIANSFLTFDNESIAIKSMNMLQEMEWQYNEDFLKLLKNFKWNEKEKTELVKSDSEIDENKKNNMGGNKLIFDTAVMQFEFLEKIEFKGPLYLKWFFDYRGRIYCSKNLVNPQSNDLSRALLLTNDTTEVEDQSIVYKYICSFLRLNHIDIENEKIKVELLEKYSLLEQGTIHEPSERLELILDLIKQLNGNYDPQFCEDKQYQIIALILEFKHFNDTKQWRIPIKLDARCNGQQHHAAIAGNKHVGKLTKLIDNVEDSNEDFYEYLAEIVKERLIDLQFDTDFIIKYLNNYLNLIDRQAMKKTVMIRGYGATKRGVREALRTTSIIKNLMKITPEQKTHLRSKCKNKLQIEGCNLTINNPHQTHIFLQDFNGLKDLNSIKLKRQKNQNITKKEWRILNMSRAIIGKYSKPGFYELAKDISQLVCAFCKGMAVRNEVKSKIMCSCESINIELKNIISHDKGSEEILEDYLDKNIEYLVLDKLTEIIWNVCKTEMKSSISIEERLDKIYSKKKDDLQFQNLESQISFKSSLTNHTTYFSRLERKTKKYHSTQILKGSMTRDIVKSFGTISFEFVKVENNIISMNKSKIKRGLLPNFTHYLDAAHLHMIVNAFFEKYPNCKTLLTIHDEFGLHPNQVKAFKEIARDTFIKLHKSKPLDEFWNQNITDREMEPFEGYEDFLDDISVDMFD